LSCEDNFADYVNKVVGNLQLINIQDACIGVAVSLYHEYDIPDGILTKTQLKALKNAADVEGFELNAEFVEKLHPVRDWLVTHICQAVQKKEIKPLVLGLAMDGSVDPIRTYVPDGRVLQWLGYRGIQAETYNYEFGMWDQLEKSLTSIDENIIHESEWLSDTINYRNTYCAYPGDDEQELDFPGLRDKIYKLESSIYRLEQENDKLRLNNGKSPTPSLINKYQERHAVKREGILGAALSVLASYPEQCKNKSGNIEATKIRAVIEEKALLFWPETGEPALSTEGTERLIREWLKKTGK